MSHRPRRPSFVSPLNLGQHLEPPSAIDDHSSSRTYQWSVVFDADAGAERDALSARSRTVWDRDKTLARRGMQAPTDLASRLANLVQSESV